MNPLMIGMLAGAGLNLIGAVADIKRVNAQEKISKKVNEANESSNKAKIMGNYSDVFEQNLSDLGSQTAIFAAAGIDKASTLFSKGLQDHEKTFLNNKENQNKDLTTVNTEAKIQRANISLNATQTKNQIAMNALTGLGNSFMNFQSYQIGREQFATPTVNRAGTSTRARRG